MHSITMNVALSRADHDLRMIARFLSMPSFIRRAAFSFASALVARWIYRTTEHMSSIVLRVAELSRLVGVEVRDEQIDAEGVLARQLSEMLEDVRSVRSSAFDMVVLAEHIDSGKITSAAKQFMAVCAEASEAISELVWAIGEHDATVASHLSGYVASTPEEIASVLDRIAAGE